MINVTVNNPLVPGIAHSFNHNFDTMPIENLYQILVDTSPFPIIVTDTAGTITSANHSAAGLVGSSCARDLCNRSFFDYMIPEESAFLTEKLDLARTSLEVEPFIISILTGTVARKTAEVNLSFFQTKDLRGFIFYIRDISLYKKAADQKIAIERQMRAVYKMEALGQLASGIAHDLNNSLGAISGYSELIRQLAPTDIEKVTRYADQISSAAQRSADVIRKVLTFARKNKMQVMSFNLNEIIEDIINLLRSSLDKNVSIIRKFNAVDAGVTGDPEQIQNAIVNLALNARDTMPSGGTLTLATDNIMVDTAFASKRPYKMIEGYYLRFSVSDTGAGMDKETLSHLFEPFFTTKEAGRGTGLGLASVYGSVKSHHGYIEVTSDLAKGSTFTMYLPVNRYAAQVENVSDRSPGAADLPARKANVLVIDDEQSIAEMIFELLSWLDYSATIFTNAVQAIAWYKSHSASVDLVIADLNMTEIDGLECFEKLRAINPSVKVLIATGYCLDEERARLLKKGVAGILLKPFVSADLAKAVTATLGAA
jgi:two-component system cell cycle sensor histidine kinase/response regulator CckA